MGSWAQGDPTLYRRPQAGNNLQGRARNCSDAGLRLISNRELAANLQHQGRPDSRAPARDLDPGACTNRRDGAARRPLFPWQSRHANLPHSQTVV